MSLKKNADGVIVREDTVEVPVTKDEIVAELNGLVVEFDDLQLRIQAAKTLLDEFEALDSQPATPAETPAPEQPQVQPDGSVNVPVQDQNETPAENAGEAQPEVPAETATDQPAQG